MANNKNTAGRGKDQTLQGKTEQWGDQKELILGGD